jgi:hypothetical protein
MCVNCLSQAEVVAAHAALATAVLREPAHRLLAELGVVDAPLPVARDARTVGFLRSLDLDPDDVLGSDVVASADRWVAAGQPRPARSRALARPSALPIGSQSRIALP